MKEKIYKKLGIVDKDGKPVPIKWWWRWIRAYWCWRYWLRYEGMPRRITNVDEMHAWNRDLIKMQDSK